MKALHYLAALWAAMMVYAISALFAGPMGREAYQQLAGERDRLEANLEDLQGINRNLIHTIDALEHDKDTQRVYARELGYGSPEERFIRIVGLSGLEPQHTIAGQRIFFKKPVVTSDRVLRFRALCAGFLVLLCFKLGALFRRHL